MATGNTLHPAHDDSADDSLARDASSAGRTDEFALAARSIFDTCKRTIGATAGFIALRGAGDASNDLLLFDGGSASSEVDPMLSMAVRGLRGRAYDLTEPLIENDFSRSAWSGAMPAGHLTIHNLLLAPLLVGGKPAGILGFTDKPGGFTDADAALAKAFSEVAAIALRNARAAQQLQQSERDLMHHLSQAQQLAEEERANARLFADAAGTLMAAIGLDGSLLFANRAFCDLIGVEESEIIGRDWISRVPDGEEREAAYQLLELLSPDAASQEIVQELYMNTPNGRRLTEWRHTLAVDRYGSTVAIVSSGMDITDRRAAEDLLRETRERLELAVSTGTIGLWDVDLTTRSGYVSPESMWILGLDESEIAAEPTKWLERVHPDDRAVADAMIEASLASPGAESSAEFRMRHRNGSYRWVLTHAASFGRPGESTTRVLGTLLDITQRKQAERTSLIIEGMQRYARTHTEQELMREFLDQLCDLLDSPIGFFHYVEDDEQTLVLQAWSTRTAEEYCATRPEELHYPIEQAGVWADCVRERRPLIHNDYASLPNKRGLPPGHAELVREFVIPIFRGNRVVAVLGMGNKVCDYTLQDVQLATHLANVVWEAAARKRSERALVESERRFRLSLEFSPYPQFLVRDGLITFMNEAGLALFGTTAEEIVGTPLTERIDPERRDRALKGMQRVIRDRDVMPLSESLFVRMDGSTVEVELSATIFEMPEGSTMVVIAKDITARKNAEREAARHQRRLSQLAAELVRSGDRERRQVAVELHDGVGQALAAAKMSARQLAAQAGDAADPELGEQLITALETAIDGVRSITSELSPPLLDAFGLGAALERLAELFMHRYGIMCDVTVEPAAGQLKNDSAVLLHRIATELLNNVHRHSGARTAHLELMLDDGSAVLIVSDRGRGFAESQLNRQDATGDHFGLFSIREEVGLVGGTMLIDSSPGRGTRVEVRIPSDLDWSGSSEDR